MARIQKNPLAYALGLVERDRAKNPPSMVDIPWIMDASANNMPLSVIHGHPAQEIQRHRRRKIEQFRGKYSDFRELEPVILEVLESGEVEPTMDHDRTFEQAYRVVKSRVAMPDLRIA